MDGTQPNVGWEPWSGANGAACAPNLTTTTIDLAGLAGGAVVAPMNCIIDWPQPWYPPPSPTYVPIVIQPPFQLTFYPTRISDEDVDRIARRVVELLREPKLREPKP